jgi:protease-4
MRLARWLAVGATVADLNRPRVVAEGERLPRRFGMEVALRPLADRRFELGLGANLSHVDRWRLAPHGRIEGRVATGLRLFGEFAWRRMPLSDGGSAVGELLALIGARFELDQAEVALAGLGRADADGGFFPGGSLLARVHANRRETLVPGETIAQIKLDNLRSDRKFVETVLLMRRVAWDPNVVAVELRIDDAKLGLGRSEELHALITALRARKKVVAYLEQASLANYYLASACDGILMDPAGSLFLGGLSHQVTYFKGALDKVGVNVEVERIAEYKGALEPFLFDGGSPPVKENHASLLDDEFGRLVAALGERRKLSEATVRTLIDKAVFSPTEAKAAGLVDVLSEEEETEAVQRWFGRRVRVAQADTTPLVSPAWFSKYVAVIIADGNIVDGEGRDFPFDDEAMVWSDPMVAALDAARTNPNVAAVVLRVNSPGGSAVASDQIARAVVRLRKAGKPVIASMGDVAASGGYYIAAPANRIYADPSTLTGSIGIYGYKVDLSGLLGKLGLVVETMRRGEKVDLFSVHRPWT